MDNLLVLNNYKFIDTSDAVKLNTNIFNMYLLDNQDLSDATLKAYKTYLNQFTIWLNTNKIDKPTEDTIKTYKLYLKDNNYTIATKNQYIRAIKHLFKWLSSRGLYKDISANIKEFRDDRKHKRDSLTISEINKIVNDIDITSEVGLRDKAIIILASTLGLRANEIVNINIGDIEQKDNVYIVNILAKGYKEKTTKKAIPQQVFNVIQDYLNSKSNKKSSDALFTSTSNRALNQRLTKETLSQIVKNRFRASGFNSTKLKPLALNLFLTKETLSQIVKNRFRASGFNSTKLTLHSLRHLTADATLKATDNNIYKTQHYLRHKNTQTTEIYLTESEDIDVNLANDVYNLIFNTDASDKSKELKDIINTLDTSDIDRVLNYIKNEVKGG